MSQSPSTPDPVAWMVRLPNGVVIGLSVGEKSCRECAASYPGSNVTPLYDHPSALPATTPSDEARPRSDSLRHAFLIETVTKVANALGFIGDPIMDQESLIEWALERAERCVACGSRAPRCDSDGVALCEAHYQHLLAVAEDTWAKARCLTKPRYTTPSDTEAWTRIQKAPDLGHGTFPPGVVAAQVVALRNRFNTMCDRLQQCVQRHGLGLGGEYVDVLICDEVDRLRGVSPSEGSAPDTPTPADKYTAGIYGKFVVRRRDGTDAPGQKHDGCEYFVLDLTHDPYALPAITAYARECADGSPALARDLDAICIRHNCATALAGIQDDPRSCPPSAPDTKPDDTTPLPCPWCGSPAELFVALGAFGVHCSGNWNCPVGPKLDVFNRHNLPAAKTAGEAILRWNRRLSSSPPEGEDTQRLEDQ